MEHTFSVFSPDDVNIVVRVRKQRLDLFYAFMFETGNLLYQVTPDKAFQLVNDLTYAATRQRLDASLYGSDASTLFPYYLEVIRIAGEILHGDNENRICVIIYEITRQINF